MKKIVIGSTILLTVLVVSGCGENENYVSLLSDTAWCAEGEGTHTLTINNDGTYKFNEEVGVWSILNNEELELRSDIGGIRIFMIDELEEEKLALVDESYDLVMYSIDEEQINNENNFQNFDYIEYDSVKDYNEGYTWIKGEKNGDGFVATMDKTGKIICNFDMTEMTCPEEMSGKLDKYRNGYAYLNYADRFEVVDTKGNTVHSFPTSFDDKVVAFGDGYVLIEQHIADFSSSKYVYTIHNWDGSILESFESPYKIENCYYCGQGVFGFSINDEYEKANQFYSATSGQWISSSSDFRVQFFDEIAVVGKDNGMFRFINVNGEVKDIPLFVEGVNITEFKPIVNENNFIIYSYVESELYNYKLSNETLYKLDTSYAEKVIWDELPDPLVFHNNKIALPMLGSDGKRYIGIFDSEWNIVCEPIQANSCLGYTEDRFILSTDDDTVIYDENGSEVFSLAEKGFFSIESYSDGVARISDDGIAPTFLDKNGEVIFDEINFENFIDW